MPSYNSAGASSLDGTRPTFLKFDAPANHPIKSQDEHRTGDRTIAAAEEAFDSPPPFMATPKQNPKRNLTKHPKKSSTNTKRGPCESAPCPIEKQKIISGVIRTSIPARIATQLRPLSPLCKDGPPKPITHGIVRASIPSRMGPAHYPRSFLGQPHSQGGRGLPTIEPIVAACPAIKAATRCHSEDYLYYDHIQESINMPPEDQSEQEPESSQHHQLIPGVNRNNILHCSDNDIMPQEPALLESPAMQETAHRSQSCPCQTAPNKEHQPQNIIAGVVRANIVLGGLTHPSSNIASQRNHPGLRKQITQGVLRANMPPRMLSTYRLSNCPSSYDLQDSAHTPNTDPSEQNDSPVTASSTQ